MKLVRPTRLLSVLFLSIPHLSDLTRQIVHNALFSALMLSAVLLTGFSSLTLRMHSSSLRRLWRLFNSPTLWFSRVPFIRLFSLSWLCHQKIVCVTPMREKTPRYLPLLSLCQSNGWNATRFPVEVGSRGFVAYLLSQISLTARLSSLLGKKSQKWSIEGFTPL